MTEQRLALGRWGEDRAVAYLQRRGIRIVARNYRCALGEIDIIAREHNSLLFIEVKTRRSAVFGLPQEAVGPRKQRQLIRTAQWYLKVSRTERLHPRFDVIAVLWQSDGSAEITHLVDAFALDA